MDKQFPIIEHQSQRVLTTAQLAESFGTDARRISENFIRNIGRYTVGKHFYALEGEEKREFLNHTQIADGLKNASVIYLWTEKGAWMHAKSLNTDQAWEAYEALVDGYYAFKQVSLDIDVSKLKPEMQMLHLLFQATAKTELELQETRKELGVMKETVETIQDTFLARDEDWRNQMNSLIKGVAYRIGIEHREIWTRSYQLLEERAKCDLDTRLRNLRKRLEDAGATKTQVKDANRMDVIESDARLKEIYSTIAKELSLGSLRVLKGESANG